MRQRRFGLGPRIVGGGAAGVGEGGVGVERLAADVAEGEDLVAVGEGDDPRRR